MPLFRAFRGYVCALAIVGAMGSAAAQAQEVRPLVVAGPASNLEIVIVAEGYTEDQQAKFFADAAAVADGLVSYGPYAATRALINVRGLFVASIESGADHPSAGTQANTRFGATYDTNGIKRLISFKTFEVLTAAAAAVPEFTLAVLLVNDPAYGGSGGSVASVSINEYAIGILRHELAHTIGGVADEYETPYPGKPPSDPEPNVASALHLDPLKWSAWIKPQTPIPTAIELATGPHTPVGAYEGARYQSKGLFRPTPKCLMRSLDDDFCPVCFEAVVTGLHARGAMLIRGWPDGDEVRCTRGACPRFEVQTAALDGLSVTWSIDGQQAQTGWAMAVPDAVAANVVVRASIQRQIPQVRVGGGDGLRQERAWQLQVDEATMTTDGDALGADAATLGFARRTGGCNAVFSGRSGHAAVLLLAVVALWMRRRRRCGSV